MEAIYDTIKLPNGGTISLDRLAYECYQGQCISSHKLNSKYVWKVTLDFECNDTNVETAVRPNVSDVELR